MGFLQVKIQNLGIWDWSLPSFGRTFRIKATLPPQFLGRTAWHRSCYSDKSGMEKLRELEVERDFTKAEVVFDSFPCTSCANKFQRALTSIDGVGEILFDPCVQRATVYFDPEKVDIPLILSTLELLCPNPRVISVMIPIKKECANDKNFDVRRLD